MAVENNSPELILINGRIATVDHSRPFAEAVAIQNGRFISVGSNEEIMRLRASNTETIDLGGRTVIPGLNDSHLHLIRGGLNYNMELRWDGVPSLGRRPADAEGAGPAHAAAAVGARGRRLDRVPVRRAAHADAGRDQRRRARHAGLRPAPLRPGSPQRAPPCGLSATRRTRPTRPAARSSATSRAIRPACSSPGPTR